MNSYQEQSSPYFENGYDNDFKLTDFGYPKSPSISLDENDDCNYCLFDTKDDVNPFEKPDKKVEIENNKTTVRTPEVLGQNIEIKDNEKNKEIKKKNNNFDKIQSISNRKRNNNLDRKPRTPEVLGQNIEIKDNEKNNEIKKKKKIMKKKKIII